MCAVELCIVFMCTAVELCNGADGQVRSGPFANDSDGKIVLYSVQLVVVTAVEESILQV